MADRETESLLARFGEYLLRSKFTDEEHARFFVIWVRKFLATAPDIPHATVDETVTLFLDSLQRAQTPDWQVEQARKAVAAWQAWRHQEQHAAPTPAAKVTVGPDGSVPADAARDAMRDTLRVRHYSYRTEQTYLDWIARFFAYLRDIGAMAEDRPIVSVDRFRDFISQLATRQNVGGRTQNQAFGALLFLYREVLGIDIGDLGRAVRARQGKRLPTVLSTDEVRRLFAQMSGTARLMAELIYGAGLRVNECCRLRVQDVDFDNNLLRVRGKGDKDRTTLLPENLKAGLKAHLERVRTLFDQDRAASVAGVYLPDALGRKYPNAGIEWAWYWVFPSRTLSLDPRANVVRRHHVSHVVIQKALAEAVRKAGIPKHATVHSLRHSFATHLLLQNVDIRQVQELLGHARVDTTMIYTHVLRDLRNTPRSPFDTLGPSPRPPS